jgi:hypothetical protein
MPRSPTTQSAKKKKIRSTYHHLLAPITHGLPPIVDNKEDTAVRCNFMTGASSGDIASNHTKMMMALDNTAPIETLRRPLLPTPK